MTPLLQTPAPREPQDGTRQEVPVVPRDRTLPGEIDAKGNYGTGVVVFTVLALLAAGLVAWYFIRRERPPKWQSMPPPETDSEAFERLCDANLLNRRERDLMRAAIGRRDGQEALGLFIDPAAFDQMAGEASAPERGALLELRRKLFSGAAEEG